MKYKCVKERKIRRIRLRALLCRKLLKQLEIGTPPLLQSLEVEILLQTIARAFGKETNTVWNLSPEEALREYAMFTVSCMQEHPDAETARLPVQKCRDSSIYKETGKNNDYRSNV